MIKHIVFDHDGTLVNTDGSVYLFEGIRELLIELKANKLKLYVWTARNRYSCVQFLKSLDIIGFFEDISTSTDCESKPSPEGLYSMLGDISPKEVIIIGDSTSDIYGAKNFGSKSIGATWSFSNKSWEENLVNAQADYICKSVEECKMILMNLIKEEQ